MPVRFVAVELECLPIDGKYDQYRTKILDVSSKLLHLIAGKTVRHASKSLTNSSAGTGRLK
jgi:hypothetical protein